MQSVIDKIKALPNAAKPDGMWSTLRRRKEKQYGKTQWKKNPIKLIPKPADALAFKQLPIPLRDKLVNTAPIKSFDPRKLVTNQPMVSQADLVHFADHGTDPEPVIILKSTDGLYVHNGNHRSALAMMRGRKVKARYIDLAQVPQLKGKKPVPQERAVDAYKMRDNDGVFTSEEALDKEARRGAQLVHTASPVSGAADRATQMALALLASHPGEDLVEEDRHHFADGQAMLKIKKAHPDWSDEKVAHEMTRAEEGSGKFAVVRKRAKALADKLADDAFAAAVEEVFAAEGHPFDGEKAEDGHGIGDCKECGKPWKNKVHWRIAAGGPGSGRHAGVTLTQSEDSHAKKNVLLDGKQVGTVKETQAKTGQKMYDSTHSSGQSFRGRTRTDAVDQMIDFHKQHVEAGGPGSGWTTENGHVSNLTPQDKGQKMQKMGFFHTEEGIKGYKEIWQHKDTGTQVHVSKYNAPNQPNLRKFEVIKPDGTKIFNGHQFSKAVEKMQTTPMQKSEMKPDTGPKVSLPSGVKQYDPTAKPDTTGKPQVTDNIRGLALKNAGYEYKGTNTNNEGKTMDAYQHPINGDYVHVTKDGNWKAFPAGGSFQPSAQGTTASSLADHVANQSAPMEPSIPASGKNAVLQDAGFHVAYTSKLVETGQPTDVWVHSTTQDAVHVIATDPTHSSWKYIPANGSPSTGKMADDLKQAIATGGKPAAADKPSSTKTSTPSEPKTPDMIPVTKEWWDKLDKAASDNWVKGGSSVMTNNPSADKPNDYHANATGWYGKVAAAMGVPISSLKYAGDRIGNLQSGTTANSGNVIGKWAQSVVNNVGQAGSVHPGTAIEYAHTQQWIKENGMPNGGTLSRGYQGTGALGTAPGFVKSQDQITLLNNLAKYQPNGFEIRLPVNGVEGFSIKSGWSAFSDSKGAVVQLHDVSPKNVISGWGTGGMVDEYASEKEWLLAFKDSAMPIRTFASGKNATVKIKSAAVSATDKIFWATLVQLKKSGWNWTVKGKKITITPPGWFTDRKNIVLDPDQMAAASMSSSSEEAAVDNLSPGSIAREMIRSKALGVSSAAYKLAGVTSFQGLPISIENKKGDVRSGVAADGSKWTIKMPFDYGYIKGTKGADGQPVDCFIGPLKDCKFAYIVHQTKFDKSGYDEDKTMLGWPSAERAEKAYRSAYNNVDLFYSMSVIPMHEFIKKVLGTKNHKRPGKIHASEVAA